MEGKTEPILSKNHRGWCKPNVLRRPGSSSRIRLRRALKAIRQETKQYCYDTSLHGFKYITSPESTTIERFIWILICALGIVICVILMCLVWQRFQETPTVTTIETTTHPIWELDFPAVTICNFNKIYAPIAEEIEKDFRRMGLTEKEINNFFTSLPKLIRPDYINVDVASGMRALASLGHTVEDLMHQLMQPCEKLLMKCAWLGQVYDCSKMFQTVKSVEGFCCAFNYQAIIADLKVPPKDDQEPFPEATTPNTNTTKSSEWVPGVNETQKVTGSGRDVGLTVVFDLEGHFYGGATRPYIGASVLIHDPDDYPEISLLTALVEPGNEVDIVITGTIIQSGRNVRGLSTENRQCWFDDEVNLGTTSQYSYQTCVTECRIDHVRSLCNCIPFYYPKLFPEVRVCDLRDVNCLRAYRRILSSLQTPIDVEAENKTLAEAQCNCLPQCNDKWYSLVTQNANVKQIKYDSPLLDSEYYSYGLDIRNLSLIHVYFRDITCLKYRKDVLLTWDGLFASFGGIFGLCLGGSVISLVELIYYYFVRIFHRKKNKTTTIYKRNSMSSKLKKKNLKRAEDTTNGRLDRLDILKHDVYFHPNYYSGNELGSLSTEFKNLRRIASISKHNIEFHE